jgi:dynein assembly factor 3, axonemal
MTLICETGISMRERMEMFLDLYGNVLIRDKTSTYLEGIVHELIQLVTEHEKCTSVLRSIFNFDTLKFKERDELEDIISGYLLCHKYDIECLRDQRLRAHFKERYDHRRNIVDWDYNFGMKDFSKSVHQMEYRRWRLNGTGFETRLANGQTPNRTFASCIPGKQVSNIFTIFLTTFVATYRKRPKITS